MHFRFERSLKNKSDFNDLTSFKSLSFWLEALLASLECYHWAFSDRLQLQMMLDGMLQLLSLLLLLLLLLLLFLLVIF